MFFITVQVEVGIQADQLGISLQNIADVTVRLIKLLLLIVDYQYTMFIGKRIVN